MLFIVDKHFHERKINMGCNIKILLASLSITRDDKQMSDYSVN